MEDRLITVETRLAHFERVAEELSDIVLEQGRGIDLLKLQVQRLQEKLADLAWEKDPVDDRPPPHY
jgi:SlyX protein